MSETGPGRRRLLRAAVGLAALGVAGAGTGAAMAEDVLPGGVRLRRALGLTGPDGTVPRVAAGPVRTTDVRSAARGRTVQLVTMLPPVASRPADLPVCVALHGRGGNARTMVDTGVPEFLAAAVAAGVPPFALVAVDGGDATYWHERTPGDDPQRMLLDELPGWLTEQNLATPTGALGISMGGSGALQYARGRGTGFGPVALLSPALFRSWPDARAIDGFRDETDWREHEPLLHLDQPHGRTLGVWCGTEDPFCPAARELAARVAGGGVAGGGVASGEEDGGVAGGGRVAQAHFPRGEHTGGFWRRVLPDAMGFLGHALHAGPAS